MIFLTVSLIKGTSVTAFKATMSSFDVITMILLMLVLARSGLDPARAIIFAWHPLVIFEGAHSGHVEAAFISFLALALVAWSRRKHALTGVALALATLIKFYPALLLPVFLVAEPDELIGNCVTRGGQLRHASFRRLMSSIIHKRNLAMLAAFAATVVLAYAPYLGAGRNVLGFLRPYIHEEGFVQSGARYFLIEGLRRLVSIPTDIFLILATAVFIGVAVWWSGRVKRDAVDVARGATVVIGLYLLVTTPRYAWYYVWMIPFLCLAPRVGWLYLTAAAALLYLVWYTPLVYPGLPLWLGAAVCVPTVMWLVWEWWENTTKLVPTVTAFTPR
jgi:hypothetical protein